MSDAMQERWLPVVGWEGLYEVSDLGRVRRIVGRNRWGYYPKITVLRTYTHPKGYQFVRLYRDNHPTGQFVHRMVARAFRGVRPKDMGVRHLDDNKRNNALTNLVYGTGVENQADSIRNGTNACIRKTHCKYGHEYTPENTFWIKNGGGRDCRKCMLRRGRESRARAKAAKQKSLLLQST